MASETQWPPQAAGRTGCRAIFGTAAQTLVFAHGSLGQSLVGRSTRPSPLARGETGCRGTACVGGGKGKALSSLLRKMSILDPVCKVSHDALKSRGFEYSFVSSLGSHNGMFQLVGPTSLGRCD